MEALQRARSIQSLHLSSDKVSNLVEKAEQIFGLRLFNEMTDGFCDQELPADWNDQFKVP